MQDASAHDLEGLFNSLLERVRVAGGALAPRRGGVAIVMPDGKSARRALGPLLHNDVRVFSRGLAAYLSARGIEEVREGRPPARRPGRKGARVLQWPKEGITRPGDHTRSARPLAAASATDAS